MADLHFLRGIGLPQLGDLNRIVRFGVLDGVSLFLGIGALAFVRRRSHLEGHVHVAKLLALVDLLLVMSVVAFAVVGSFWVALVLFRIVGGLRSVRAPIFTAWINQGLDPATRATINSMGGQADAVGQAMAGPVVGGIGRAVSVPWAISVAGLLRLPVLVLYLRAIRHGSAGDPGSGSHEPRAGSDRGMMATRASAGSRPPRSYAHETSGCGETLCL